MCEHFDEKSKDLTVGQLAQIIEQKNLILKEMKNRILTMELGIEKVYDDREKYIDIAQTQEKLMKLHFRLSKKIYRNCFKFLNLVPKTKRTVALNHLQKTKGLCKRLLK